MGITGTAVALNGVGVASTVTTAVVVGEVGVAVISTTAVISDEVGVAGAMVTSADIGGSGVVEAVSVQAMSVVITANVSNDMQYLNITSWRYWTDLPALYFQKSLEALAGSGGAYYG